MDRSRRFFLVLVYEHLLLKWLRSQMREIMDLQTAAVGLLLERIRVLTERLQEKDERPADDGL
ncbi:MAG: hypothetical protein ACKVT0_23165 [Planctomycetaceae bacterium]